MRLRISLLAAALLCGAAVVFPASGWAAREDASFGLRPLKYDPALSATKSYFILAAKPGDVIHDQVRVVNTGRKTGTAYLYPVDATTGQTSGAVYLSRQSPRRDVGAWIRLSRSSVTLAPGKNAVVDFTIRVPRLVRPGDHLGGIVAENSQIQQASSKGALRIRIQLLTITAVLVQLPGPIVARVDVTSVRAVGQHGYQFVDLHLVNSGTAMAKPLGRVLISAADGKPVSARALKLDTFLPGTAIDYPLLLPAKALPPGRYRATVDLSSWPASLGYRRTARQTHSISRSFDFTVSNGQYTTLFQGVKPLSPTQAAPSSSSFPWMLIVAVMAALLALVAVSVVLVRRWPTR